MDIYNVSSDDWQPAPEIKVARVRHSSCCLQDFAYIFGGFNESACRYLNSFERIDLGAFIRGSRSVEWEQFTLTNQADLTPRRIAAMSAIGEN